ncbi:MAG: hypothetical protein LCH82_08475 [Actinobacteria bacterium]|nr:hypothetical protein [Actinomycetota bacterium]
MAVLSRQPAGTVGGGAVAVPPVSVGGPVTPGRAAHRGCGDQNGGEHSPGEASTRHTENSRESTWAAERYASY